MTWGITLALIATVSLSVWSRTRSVAGGATGGRLADCPSSPNCVCSQASDPAHMIDPLPWRGSKAGSLDRLRKVVHDMPRATIIADNDAGYLHVEFRTRWLRFVDDVEFLVDATAQVIHVRSASRVGHSDMGTNRRRVESIRQRYLNQKP